MTLSRLQKAVDGAWALVQASVGQATTKGAEAEALTALKQAFRKHELPPRATHVPVGGAWPPWADGERRDIGEVERRDRTYEPPTVVGLTEFVATVALDMAALDALAGENVAESTEVLAELGRQAVLQQLEYAVDLVLGKAVADNGTLALPVLVRAARSAFREDSAALDLLLHVGAPDMPDPVQKEVRAALQGGSVRKLPAPALHGQAVVLRRRPDGVTWHTAFDFDLGWSAVNSETAEVGVMSRLLLHPATAHPWCYKGSVSA